MNAIEQLLKLQEIDTRVRQIEKRLLKDIPARKQAVTATLESQKAAVASAREGLKARQLELKHLEADVEAHKEKIARLRMQQYELKSNKEFKAMEDEIRGVEKVISDLEDKALATMEAVEVTRKNLEEGERKLGEEAKQAELELAELDRMAAELQGQLEGLRTARNEAAAAVDPKWLRYYERIMRSREPAVVPVEDGICGGCHMKLPPASYHEAKKQSDVVTCGYCGRMLYVKTD